MLIFKVWFWFFFSIFHCHLLKIYKYRVRMRGNINRKLNCNFPPSHFVLCVTMQVVWCEYKEVKRPSLTALVILTQQKSHLLARVNASPGSSSSSQCFIERKKKELEIFFISSVNSRCKRTDVCCGVSCCVLCVFFLLSVCSGLHGAVSELLKPVFVSPSLLLVLTALPAEGETLTQTVCARFSRDTLSPSNRMCGNSVRASGFGCLFGFLIHVGFLSSFGGCGYCVCCVCSVPLCANSSFLCTFPIVVFHSLVLPLTPVLCSHLSLVSPLFSSVPVISVSQTSPYL